ncbi:hypothetical protein H0H93_002328, partial [Arthromyces matolae]
SYIVIILATPECGLPTQQQILALDGIHADELPNPWRGHQPVDGFIQTPFPTLYSELVRILNDVRKLKFEHVGKREIILLSRDLHAAMYLDTLQMGSWDRFPVYRKHYAGDVELLRGYLKEMTSMVPEITIKYEEEMKPVKHEEEEKPVKHEEGRKPVDYAEEKKEVLRFLEFYTAFEGCHDSYENALRTSGQGHRRL